MATYYMRADGTATSKANATSLADPSTSMSISVFNTQTFVDGDIIVMGSVGGAYSDKIIPPSNGGASGITLRNNTGDTPLNAVTSDYGLHIIQSNWTIEGLTFSGSTSHAIMAGGVTDNVTFTNINILDSGGNGFNLGGSGAVHIEGGVVSNNGISGVYVLVADTVTLNGVDVNNNSVDGISSNNDSIVTATGCTVYDNGSASLAHSGDGFTAHDGSTLNVHSCVIYGNFKSGVAVTGTSTGSILNNTIYNNYDESNTIGWTSSYGCGIAINTSGDWDVKNNICQYNGQEMVITALATGIIGSDYNCLYDTRNGGYHYDGVDYATFSEYNIASGLDGNSTIADPEFVSVETHDFNIKSTSSCRSTGIDVGLTTDFEGTALTPSTSYPYLISGEHITGLLGIKTDVGTVIALPVQMPEDNKVAVSVTPDLGGASVPAISSMFVTQDSRGSLYQLTTDIGAYGYAHATGGGTFSVLATDIVQDVQAVWGFSVEQIAINTIEATITKDGAIKFTSDVIVGDLDHSNLNTMELGDIPANIATVEAKEI